MYNRLEWKASLAVLATAMCSTQAFAQESPAQVEDDGIAEKDADGENVIIVRGAAAADRAAISIKRNADVIVDALSAEDIGQLPDRSIGDALETLPGVTGNRDRGRSNIVSVRGLGGDFTLVTVDGRVASNAFGGRATNLEVFPSEFVGEAIVFKTPSPDAIEGGVGGTVELSSRKPLDFDETFLNLNVFGLYNPESSQIRNNTGLGSRISGALATKFADDKVGVLITAARVRESIVNQRFTFDFGRTGDFCGAGPLCDQPPFTGPDGFGGDFNFFGDFDGDGVDDPIQPFFTAEPSATQQNRDSIAASFQWDATPDFRLTLDGLFTRNTIDGQGGTLFVNAFTDNSTISNVIVGETGDVVAFSNTASTAQFFSSSFGSENVNQAAGLNADFNIGQWDFNLDASYSLATRTFRFLLARSDVLSGLTLNQTGIDNFIPTGNIVDNATGEALNLGDPSFLPDGFGINRLSSAAPEDINDQLWALRADISRPIKGNFLSEFSAGVRFSSRTRSRERFEEGGAIEPSEDNPFPTALEAVAPGPFEDGGNFSSFGNNNFLGDGNILFFDPDFIFESLGSPNLEGGGTFNPSEFFDITEETLAGYARLDFDTILGTIGLSGHGGLRIVRTTSRSEGFVSDSTVEANLVNGMPQLSVTDLGTFTPVTERNSFTDFLPSLNLTATFTNEFLLRFGAGRTLTRPNFTDLRANVVADETGRVVRDVAFSAGNPQLEPIRAWQADLSGEYYFSESTFIAVGGFVKSLDGLFVPVGLPAEALTFIDNTGLNLPTPDFASIANSGDSVFLAGIELSGRFTFESLPGPLSNLFVYGNYSVIDFSDEAFIDFDIGTDPLNDTGDPTQDRDPFRDVFLFNRFIEETWTLGAGYDDGALSGRVFFSRNSELLQDENLRPPRPRRADGRLNASIRYKLNDNITFFGFASNILNEVQSFGDLGVNQNTFASEPISGSFDRTVRAEAEGRSFLFGITLVN